MRGLQPGPVVGGLPLPAGGAATATDAATPAVTSANANHLSLMRSPPFVFGTYMMRREAETCANRHAPRLPILTSASKVREDFRLRTCRGRHPSGAQASDPSSARSDICS